MVNLNNEVIAEASSNLYANAEWEFVQPLHEANWEDSIACDYIYY